MKWLIFLLFVLFTLCVHAQTVLTVDRTEAVIGDQLKATITTNLADGREWRNINEVWPDTMQGIEVVSGPQIDNKNPASTRATWNIAVFDTGWVRIPALKVAIRDGNQIDTIITNDIPVMVHSIEPDSSGLAPIKDIIKQPFSLGYYKKYIPHFLIALAILVGLYLWWRKRNRKVEEPEVIVPDPLPHEWAFRALDELEEKRLWQSGEIKEHYTMLTAILRGYLERRYSINALEQTSDEIIYQLRQQSLSADLLDDTAHLLSVSDLIKFAKGNPGIDIHTTTIQRVRKFVEETLFIPPPEIATDKSTADEPVE